jgi:hypothetical protein
MIRPWRTGRKVGNTIYAMVGEEPSDDDELIGVMFKPELAIAAVAAHNARLSDPYDALWDIAWHTGYEVRLGIRGSHMNYSCVTVGEHEIVGEDLDQRLVAWAKMLRRREANAPIPGPPPAASSSP